jgi:hypothetical protein
VPIDINPDVFGKAAESVFENLGKSSTGEVNILGKAIQHMGSLDNIGGKSGPVLNKAMSAYSQARDAKMLELSRFGSQKAGPGAFTGPPQQSWMIERTAKNHARGLVGLENDMNWIGIIKAVKNEHGPYTAQRVAIQLQNEFGDLPYPIKDRPTYETDPATGQTIERATTGMQGRLRRNISAEPDLSDVLLGKQGQFGAMPLPPAWEKQMWGEASRVSRLGDIAMLPRVTVKHIPQITTGGIPNASFRNQMLWFTSMFGSGRKGTEQLMLANGVGGEFYHRAIEDDYRWRTGKMQNYIPGPVGQFLQKNMVAPGLGYMRDKMVLGSIGQGYGIMNEAVQKLLLDPKDQTARMAMTYLRLDPTEVMAYFKANGQISPEHMQTALYENMVQRAYTRNPAIKSLWQSSPSGGFMNQYHSFQQAYRRSVQRNFMQALQTGDAGRIAAMLAHYAIIYPAVAWGTYSLVRLMTGRDDPQEALKRVTHPVDVISDAKNYGDDINFLLDQMGLGILYSELNSASQHRLLNTLAGPKINFAANYLEDAASGIAGSMKGQKKAMYPISRDIFNTFPIGGSILAHKLFPTRAEEQAKKPMTARRLAAQRSAARRKAKEENQ